MPDTTGAPAAKSETLLQELHALVALSWPLALSNLAQLAMGTTDVMMMGRLGSDTLAAGALGTNLYFVALIFGIGLLNAATPMIAKEIGHNPSTSRSKPSASPTRTAPATTPTRTSLRSPSSGSTPRTTPKSAPNRLSSTPS